MKRIAYVVLLAFILSSCREVSLPVETPTPDIGFPEDEDLTEFIATMDDVAQQFESLVHVAKDTPAENLEPVIKEMQGVRQDVANIDTPPSAIATKAALDSYMYSTIQCNFQIYADEVAVEETQLPEGKTDFCRLAPDQLAYYNIKMDELKGLLNESLLNPIFITEADMAHHKGHAMLLSAAFAPPLMIWRRVPLRMLSAYENGPPSY